MKLDKVLTFGKYKGRTIEEIWAGITPLNENDILEKYMIELCDFLLENDFNPKIVPSSSFDLSKCSNELLFFSQSLDAKKIKIRNNKIIIIANDNNIKIALFKVLSSILTESFIGKAKHYVKNSIDKPIQYSKNSIHFQFLQASPTYIKWCIENVKYFFFR